MLLGQFCKISWDAEIWRYHLAYSHKYSVQSLLLQCQTISVSTFYKEIMLQKRIFNCFCCENDSAFSLPTILFKKKGKEIALHWTSRIFLLPFKSIIKPQNILSWKRSITITKSSSWLHTKTPKNQVICLRTLTKCFLTPAAWCHDPGEAIPCPPPSGEETFPDIQPNPQHGLRIPQRVAPESG